ncbi:MAG: DEAD/DEAH box helicase [Chloroflexi bacterium]|nr:DEAD/DEAH box helicase [Chloroflexota bacterium]
MVALEPGTTSSDARLAGLLLGVPRTLPRRGAISFAALTFDGDTIQSTFEGALETDAARLQALAEGTPIVTDAPRATVDLLSRIGVQHPIVWDVLELAGLIVPSCPSDTLQRAAEFFSLAQLKDGGSELVARAQLALNLFSLLVCLLDGAETSILQHVNRLAAGLDWPLRTLFQEIERQRARSSLETGVLASATPIGGWIARGAPPRRRQATEPDPHPPWLDPADVAERLSVQAPLAQALPGYEPRQEQARMAQLVTEALNTGSRLIVEAGTGTGKSVAYLLPAALHAVRSKRRVVVATATTTLQDQLFGQDVPLVQRALGSESDAQLRATVLKGRANYLCLQRWQTLLHASDLAPADRSLLIKTLFWLPQTHTGDRAELHLSPAEEDAWQRVAAVADTCTPVLCPYHRIGVCFLARARRAAEESHVVITNHALLLSDLATRARVLPEAHVLIIDEAHHLEDEATQQLGWRLGERELLNRLERLWRPGHGATGAIPEALAVVTSSSGLQVSAALAVELERGERAVSELVSHVRRFFEGLARLLEDRDLVGIGVTGPNDETTLRVTSAVRAGSAWEELEEIWSSALEHLQALERVMALVCAELETVPNAPEAARELANELTNQLEYWRDMRRRLQTAVHAPDGRAVYWISGGSRFRSAWLSSAPLEVASLLRERLFGAPETVALVSATLAIGGSFDYVKRRLGLEDAAALDLGSPFDYARAALLYVPNDLPDPSQPGYQAQLEQAIVDVITRLRGRTLVLFTSRAHLRTTYQGVRDQLASQHVTLLGQGIDESSRTRLLDAFRRGSRVALFGTNAFWEGIDVVGHALSCVVVARLPFAVPSDPVYAARAEQFDDPFNQYAVPQAVLRLKQGFGRLIRSRSDRGAVVVLDRRLVTRFYGQVFLRSLPPCTIKQGPIRRTGSEIEDWLGVSSEQQLALEAVR